MGGRSPIAVVSMSVIVPGSASVEAYWDHIIEKKLAIADVAQDRWIADFSHVIGDGWKPDKAISRKAGLIADFSFDPSGFAIDSDLLTRIDPLYRLVLSAGRAALRPLHLSPEIRRRTRVILASIALPTDQSARLTRNIFEAIPAPGAKTPHPFPKLSGVDVLGCRVTGLPASLLAAAFGLEGGSFTLDAACASSLYSVKLACDDLADGVCDLAVAGGVSRPDCLFTQIGFSQLRALSPSGRCAPFDRRADGLVVGEGAGILVLKRLEDALAAGDRVLAVIRGIGVSNDIRGNLLAPDSEGQVRAMRMAYENAGWRPSDVGLIECHGAGTPVGDAVELSSLRALWKDDTGWDVGQCAIGSVKSMIGHLLTAAGAAGLIKTILALKHGVLPPSLNFTEASPNSPIHGSPFRVQTTAEKWPLPVRRDGLRRAAVSAFGFGGINAHVLVEQWRPEAGKRRNLHSTGPAPAGFTSPEPVAIVGMAAQIGDLKNLDALEKAIFRGSLPTGERPPNRWRGIESVLPGALKDIGRIGRYVDAIDTPPGRFHIPPNEIPDILPQQLLLLKTADAARRDAGLQTDKADTRCGVVIGIRFDMEASRYHLRWNLENRIDPSTVSGEIFSRTRERLCPPLTATRTLGSLGSIVASRVAREFRLGGPGITVSADEISGLKALYIGARSLIHHELDTVFVGAVDLAGDARWVLSSHAVTPYGKAPDCRPFDPDSSGAVPGEGAVVLVLKRLSDAVSSGNRIYAVIRGFGEAGGGSPLSSPSPERYRRSLEAALKNAHRLPAEISYVEGGGTSRMDADEAEAKALSAVLGAAFPTGIGAATPVTGQTGAVSGLLGVVKTALGLHRRVLPPLAGFKSGVPSLNRAGQFHVPPLAGFWAVDRDQTPRSAVSGCWDLDYNAFHVVLEQAPPVGPGPAVSVTQEIGVRPARLFWLEADSRESLLARIENILADSNVSGKFKDFAVSWNGANLPATGRHRIVFLIKSERELSNLLERAASVIAGGQPTLLGPMSDIAYLPDPVHGEIAFVYPGAGNHYLGMGRELGVAFSPIAAELNEKTDHYKSQGLPHLFNPDRVDWTDGWQADALGAINSDPRHVIFGQVAFSMLTTAILLHAGIGPQAAIGYSLGESAALFALGAWPAPEIMRLRMLDSPLFSMDLTGDYRAVKKAWGLPAATPVHWRTAVVQEPADRIRPLLEAFPRCRLLISNSPRECVIAGLERDVSALVRTASASAVYLEAVAAVHCDVMAPVQTDYWKMHYFEETRPVEGVRFYSTAAGKAISLMPRSVADAITRQAVEGFDFTRTIEQAYADGVRVFVEMGPGNSSTRMISTILQGRPHVSLSLSDKSASEVHTFYRAVGNLFASGETTTSRPHRLDAGQPPAGPAPLGSIFDMMAGVGKRVGESAARTAEAHETYLNLSQSLTRGYAKVFGLQTRLVGAGAAAANPSPVPPEPAFDRRKCLEFAIGSIEKVLGPEFAKADTYPTRVRLPDEPLMFVDRIVEIRGVKGALGPGSIVTEHDVRPGAWYLDGGRVPACVAVEAGQADLFLSAYLGIDLEVKGLRTYRLLDATVSFHGPLPGPNETIRYTIHIDRFVRQGKTWLFFFRFEGSVGRKPLITMKDGCAGFFTPQEVENSGGILLTETEKDQMQAPAGPSVPLILSPLGVRPGPEAYDERRLEALRRGDFVTCFGPEFTGIRVAPGQWLPGGRMHLIDRITLLDPHGGRHGRGIIRAEADIRPQHWFLTCHFVDDKVMPGTLMYECCSHTLRVFLQRAGWVSESAGSRFEPVPGIPARLKCRGPVTPDTRKVVYEVEIRKMGYGPEPYVIADAHMYADGRYIVLFRDMSLRLTDMSEEELMRLWAPTTQKRAPIPVFSHSQLISFAMGRPSAAFGPVYAPFDEERFIARLPSPPYLFMDRVIAADCEPMKLKPGGWIESEYSFSADAWFFAANRAPVMPIAVMLEIALQPCGWLAAYMGSALRSEKDLHFRNLDGSATLYRHLTPRSCRLTVRARLTQVSEAADMIIEAFEFEVLEAGDPVYKGTTTFGFFTSEALSAQAGIRGVQPLPDGPPASTGCPTGSIAIPRLPPFFPQDPAPDRDFNVRHDRSFPARALCMLDEIACFSPEGGPKGLGVIRGTKEVDPSEWFFTAHFFKDPVCPGSLGVESFLQLLRAAAGRMWPSLVYTHAAAPLRNSPHTWSYRGQILRGNKTVTIQADILNRNPFPAPALAANGLLAVDGLTIYDLKGFGIELIPVD